VRMPLTAEFKHHLHELMVETSDKLRDELNDYKRNLVWEAQQTHNAAAIPNAHSKASIHAFRTRVKATVAAYLQALENFGIDVDDGIELEMLALIGQLTGATPSLSLPPAVRSPNVEAVRRAQRMEASRIGNTLQREAANRLREMKAKSRRSRATVNFAALAPPSDPSTPKKPDAASGTFISYSWETEYHRGWVLRLAERLRSQGVRVVLDVWHLKVGGDRTHFMESNISDCEFVIIICTPTYAQKANGRDGGVGYEAMIITSQLAGNILQDKFIPVLRSGRFDDSAVPIWLQSKRGVDLRGEPYDEQQYEVLLTALHKAQPAAPPVGPKPAFLTSDAAGLAPNAVSVLVGQESASESISEAAATAKGGVGPQQSPVAYAWYETTGPNATRIQVFVRPTGNDGRMFKFETSTGEKMNGTESEVAEKYLIFDARLRGRGYLRMTTFNGTGGRNFNLP
jgi:TIR domain